jgi:hypothetical protein
MSGPCARRCGPLSLAWFSPCSGARRRGSVCLVLPCFPVALRCDLSPRSAHGGRGWPDSTWFAQVLRAAVRTGQGGVCSLVSACGGDNLRVWQCVLDLVLPGGAWLVSDPGWLVEDSALDENPAMTSSTPAVTASADVVFFLGSIAVELVVLPTPWLRSPGENLRSDLSDRVTVVS